MFQADKAYGGFVLDMRAAWRTGEAILWGIARYQSLSAAVFKDSPLVEDKNYFFDGHGVNVGIYG